MQWGAPHKNFRTEVQWGAPHAWGAWGAWDAVRCIEVHEVHPWYGEITRYGEITAFLRARTWKWTWKVIFLTFFNLYVFGKLRPNWKWICWNFYDPRSLEVIRGHLRPAWAVPHFVPHLWHLWHTYQMCHTLWHIWVLASILRARHNVRGRSELIGQGGEIEVNVNPVPRKKSMMQYHRAPAWSTHPSGPRYK